MKHKRKAKKLLKAIIITIIGILLWKIVIHINGELLPLFLPLFAWMIETVGNIVIDDIFEYKKKSDDNEE